MPHWRLTKASAASNGWNETVIKDMGQMNKRAILEVIGHGALEARMFKYDRQKTEA
jgi:hypothetical protein